MALAMPTRQEVRKGFGRLAEASLAGSDNPFQAVYDYAEEDFEGQSPVLTLGSAGSMRERITRQGSKPAYYITAFIFVLKGEAGNANYTIQDADDALDSCEAALGELIDDNQSGASWKRVAYEARSFVETAIIAGEAYWMEPVPLIFEVM